MSRSAAARVDHDRARRTPYAPGVPRRVSGPVRTPRARIDPRALAMSDAALAPAPRPRVPSRPPPRLAAGGASLVLRVADAAVGVSGSRTMDRLVRSRAWVVIVGFGLIGIVAMQVSMLKLNSGIGRAVETAATLERSNATLRAQVSRLSSGDRIQALAGSRGFLMPEPSDVTFLRAGSLGIDGARAARRMQAPNAEIAGPAGSMTVADSVKAITATEAPATAAGAPTAADTAGARAAPAAATATATPTAAGGATAPAVSAPTATQAAAPAAATAATAAAGATPAATASGGVTIP
jgi:hypothetical protein